MFVVKCKQVVQLKLRLGLVTEQSDYKMDKLDAALLQALQRDARIGVLELSRRLDVARGTVQSRIDRMVAAGVIRNFSASMNLDALGFDVKAYVTIDVKQGQMDSVVVELLKVDEVIEAHAVASQGDMLCLIAARSNEHLMEVLERIVKIPDIARTSTAIVLKTQIENRCSQLLKVKKG